MAAILTSFAFLIVFVQAITAICIPNSPISSPALAYAPDLSTAKGSFSVRSVSPIAPTGVKILSDQLVIEGPLTIDGQLPFLGTVALEGAVQSLGVGNVAHSCGGAVGISSEIAPSFGPATKGLGPLGPGFIGGKGLGLGTACNRLF